MASLSSEMFAAQSIYREEALSRYFLAKALSALQDHSHANAEYQIAAKLFEEVGDVHGRKLCLNERAILT